MPLDIKGATTGYDSSATEQLLQDIKANAITKAADELDAQFNTLENSVNEIWQGKSSEIFIQNMRKDVETIKNALNSAYEALQSEVNQIVSEFSNVDQNLVKERG